MVMESTAQCFWKPVWQQLEGQCQLYLAQAQSNRGPRGRKRDFVDAERLVRRQVAGELILSFVPDGEQRLWRIMSRTKYQLRRDRVRLQNQLEAFLEEARIPSYPAVSAICRGSVAGGSLEAMSKGESDLGKLSAMVSSQNLRATPDQLQDALQGAKQLSEPHRQVLGLFLARLKLIEEQIEALNSNLGQSLRQYTMPWSAWPRCQAWVSIRRSR